MAKGRWVKLYSRILLDPDVMKLSDKEFRFFINLLVVAGELQTKGKVPQKWLETVTKTSRMYMNSHSDILEKLRYNGFISILADGVKIRNWYKYQSTTAERREREGRRNAALEKIREDKSREEYIKVFAVWNDHPKIKPKHRTLTTGIIKALNARVEHFSIDEICQAIKNYGDSDDPFWIEQREAKKIWGLGVFLSRGEGEKVEKFLAGPIRETRKGSAPGAGRHTEPKTKPGEAHPCVKARAVHAGGHDCERFKAWLVDPKSNKYPCEGCNDLFGAR